MYISGNKSQRNALLILLEFVQSLLRYFFPIFAHCAALSLSLVRGHFLFQNRCQHFPKVFKLKRRRIIFLMRQISWLMQTHISKMMLLADTEQSVITRPKVFFARTRKTQFFGPNSLHLYICLNLNQAMSDIASNAFFFEDIF